MNFNGYILTAAVIGICGGLGIYTVSELPTDIVAVPEVVQHTHVLEVPSMRQENNTNFIVDQEKEWESKYANLARYRSARGGTQ